MTKPKILIVENSIDVTGALKSIIQACCDLRNMFDFYFVIPSRSGARTFIEKAGFQNIDELAFVEISRRKQDLFIYIPRLLINAKKLSKITAKHKFALIHANDFYNLVPTLVHIIRRTPYTCHVRFLPDRFPRWLLKAWLTIHFRYASRIVLVSQSVARLLPQHRKFEVVYNELPTNTTFFETTPQKESYSKHGYRFLYLSNYIRGKGHEFALRSFAKIHEQIQGWKIRFVGGDMGMQKNKDYSMQLVNLAKELKIDQKVEWMGFTDDVQSEYRDADIVLNFSESESFSITCLEALYFGKPVIASDCGGPGEIIDHQKSGLLVQNRNVDQMAVAMLQLANGAQLRAAMGHFGSLAVREKFSQANTSYKLKKIFDHAIACKK